MTDYLDDEESFRGKLSHRARHNSHRRRSRSRGPSRGPTRSNFGRGRHVATPHAAAQRAAVKITSVRLTNRGKQRAAAHAKYLQRDGAGRDGEPATAYSKDAADVDIDAFNARCDGDRHQFRVILSPEFGSDLDLSAYARDVMDKVAEDLDTDLDWVAVNHHNTDKPHVHLILRGVDDEGADLVLNRDYICHGFRARAREVASLHLGPRTPEQVARARERGLSAERFTDVDQELLERADTHNVVHLGVEDASSDSLRQRSEHLQRVEKLESLGLAQPMSPNAWQLDKNLESELRDLARQRDIIRRMYAARRTDASRWSFEPDSPTPVVGRLLDRGLADEHRDDDYLIIDGADGRVHHVEAPTLAPGSPRPAVGDLVQVTPSGDTSPSVERLDARPVLDQIRYPGPTYLDQALVHGCPDLADEGFGGELQTALKARHTQLAEWQLVDSSTGSVPRDLIKPLRAKERAALLSREASRRNKRPVDLSAGDRLRGRVSPAIELAGGTYHLVEDDRRVVVLPSNRYLKQHAGEVADVSMRRTANGRLRPYVRSVDPNTEMER